MLTHPKIYDLSGKIFENKDIDKEDEVSGLTQAARWGWRMGRIEGDKGSAFFISNPVLLPLHEAQNMNQQPLPLLFRVLFQGTHTLLRATRKNKEMYHKIKHYNINPEILYKRAAHTLQKC